MASAHGFSRRLLKWTLALTTGAVLALPAGIAGATATEATGRADDGHVLISGRGNGHGRGMSQWGAQGAATSGLSHEQILDFYYPGAALQVAADREIRVKLTAEDTDLVVDANAEVRVTDRATGVTLNWTGLGPQARVRLADDGFLRIQYTRGGTWIDAQNPAWPSSRVAGPVTVSGPGGLWVQNSDGTQRAYRGILTMGRSGAGTEVVNTLGIEQYLYGVVPRESPSWFHPAALRAQAVAARSYARSPCSGGDPDFDVLDTTSCQVYGGRALRRDGRETTLETASSAVDATRSTVLVRGGGVLRAEFSASNGGRIVASDVGPAKDDPYDAVDPRSVGPWQLRAPLAGLERVAGVGTVREVRVASRSGGGEWGGRVATIVVTGDRGATTVTGAQARAAFGLRSDWFFFVGVSRPSGLVLSVTQGDAVTVASVLPTGAAAPAMSAPGASLTVGDRSDWEFAFRGPGPQPDLFAVKRRNTGSGFVEVHVLSGASGYRTFTRHATTALPAVGTQAGAGWQFAVASHAGSGRADLFALRTGPSGSGRTEVHVLSDASDYRSWVGHYATALPTIDDEVVTLIVDDTGGAGDLTAVMRSATGSGRTEAHRLTQASGYQQFSQHAATALHEDIARSFDFGLADENSDGTPDLYALKRAATPSGRLEIHVMDGSRDFTTWLSHAETAATPAAGTSLRVRQS